MEITVRVIHSGKVRICECECNRQPGLIAMLGPFRQKEKIPMSPIQVTITDAEEFDVTVTAGQDADGNPTALAGPVTCAPVDPTAFDVVQLMDNTQTPPVAVPNGFTLKAAQVPGKLGLQKVVFSDGVGTVEYDVTVNTGAEVGLNTTTSTPRPIS